MKFTLMLIAICVIAFIYTAYVGGDAFVNEYGFSGPNLISRPWTVVTSIFLHANITHLLSNILVLFFFGIAVEKEMKWKKMLVIFFLGAFAGSLVSLFFYPWDTISIGASAGVFALIGVGMLVKPLDLSFYPLIVPIPLALLGILYALYNAYGFITEPTSEISYIAHFGGLAVGLIFGIKHAGIKRSLMIIGVVLAIMIAIPLLWFLLVK